MDESRLFKSGDNLNIPACRRPDPLSKCTRVACIAQGAGGNHAYRVRTRFLRRPMKSSQDLDRLSHRVRRKKSVAKYALTQARYLAIFMNFLQTVPAKTGNFQPDRIGSDVNRGKGRHGRRPVYSL